VPEASVVAKTPGVEAALPAAKRWPAPEAPVGVKPRLGPEAALSAAEQWPAPEAPVVAKTRPGVEAALPAA
jgi:hypothetical protein